ncbi:hypothetical protein BV394_00725 [Brevirhabdus pacifica]|uniref:Uncharacterized protein n=1 Tax=Brevirhabdus pacifica TaxID=1267768 RepID=A0A1U7DEQ6_9RHOB|nr:hypothetical protein BV394_00725 [Brevirhabdus pacifica]OWU79744.1 membrane protein [Loktanella sp. 22II-4b]PJJ87100.1 protein-disulfide isomerase [Brevirhabdus pacifica]
MRHFTRMAATAALITAPMMTPVALSAQEMDEAKVKSLVYEAIRENPEIVMEAVAILQKRENDAASAAEQNQQSALESQRELIERDPNAPVVGNPDGDVTVVEFFDYNCPYCKKAAGEVKKLIEKDTNVRVVYREWPVLGEGSVYAARAALAARKQDKYEEFHHAMMNLSGRANEESVTKVAKEIGLDLEQMKADMQDPEVDEHIATSMSLTQALGFRGTPSFVIGDALIPGLIELDQLEIYVDDAREGS